MLCCALPLLDRILIPLFILELILEIQSFGIGSICAEFVSKLKKKRSARSSVELNYGYAAKQNSRYRGLRCCHAQLARAAILLPSYCKYANRQTSSAG